MPAARRPKDPDKPFRDARPADKPIKLSDSGGLYLLVSPAGAKVWRYRYRFPGRDKKTGQPKLVERTLVIGQYPQIPLVGGKNEAGVWVDGARELRDAARKLLHSGKDPGRERRAEKRRAQIGSATTMKAVIEDWIDANRHIWTPGHVGRTKRRLEVDIYPDLGDLPVKEISPQDVLVVLRKVEGRSHEMAHRLKQHLSAAFRFAIAEGRCESDPTRDLSDALKPVDRSKHHAALTERDMPVFFERLASYDGITRPTVIAINLMILAVPRTIELRMARWSEFNLDAAEWRVPAARMKERVEHVSPLSRQAVALLREMQTLSGDDPADYVFPSQMRPNKCMSENTILFALYRLGYHGRATGHGFRTLFSTTLNESGVNSDWIEVQLAHAPVDKVRAAYNRASYLPQRREMMQAWADRVDGWRTGANVVAIRSKTA